MKRLVSTVCIIGILLVGGCVNYKEKQQEFENCLNIGDKGLPYYWDNDAQMCKKVDDGCFTLHEWDEIPIYEGDSVEIRINGSVYALDDFELDYNNSGWEEMTYNGHRVQVYDINEKWKLGQCVENRKMISMGFYYLNTIENICRDSEFEVCRKGDADET